MMEKILRGDNITLGVCCYSEHWEQGLWKEDLLRLKQNGIAVVRIGEFAWNKNEPAEGNFTFAFFDSFLALAAETDMGVIFGTPTAVLTLKKELRDLYTGKPLRGRVALPPYGTAVYKGDV
jgi:beta-galactosidase